MRGSDTLESVAPSDDLPGTASTSDAGEREPLSPKLVELARLIQQHVDRFIADDDADPQVLSDFLDELPRRERARLAGEVFAGLPPERQWEILAALFDDAELRGHLDKERARRLEWLRDGADLEAAVVAARVSGALDLRVVPVGVEVALGLFRSEDVRAAADRGSASDVCARRVVLRMESPDGEARVIDDTFNPRGGLFVTPGYDSSVWKRERWPGHALVRVGAAVAGVDGALEPVLFPGARVDVEFDGEIHHGRLHLGYVVIEGEDVFTGRR